MADSAFEREFLEAHNEYRQQHGAPPLTMSSDLNRSAQKWAEYLLTTKKMQHSQSDHGENLFYAWSSRPKKHTGKEAVDSWYSEIKDYNFSRPGFQSKTGHFTQVVWKGSKELGVGLATDGATTFVVGQYLPRGNIANPGYFEENVLPPGSSVKPDSDTGETQQKSGSGQSGLSRFFPWQAGRDYNSGTHTSKNVNTDENDFNLSALNAMNSFRRQHGAKPLSLCPSLAKEAQEWAAFLVNSKMLKNSGKGHGESLYYWSGSNTPTPEGSDVVKSWYDESSKYDFSTPGFQKGTGNFTQMVWKSSEKVGFGVANDNAGMLISVAFFEPPGNVTNKGYFQDNVSPRS